MPLRPVLGGPLDLAHAGLGIGDRDVGDAEVAVGCLRHEVGEPAVVDAHADRLEVVVPRVAPGDEAGRRERDRLPVEAAVEDDCTRPRRRGPCRRGGRRCPAGRDEAGLVAALEEPAVDLVGVAEAGDLAELGGFASVRELRPWA